MLKDLLEKAVHIPPAQYSRGKHWRGNSEEQRRQTSENRGPSQFRYELTAEDVKALEQVTLLEGETVEKGHGTYHAYKQHDEQIGYAEGKDAYWLRAELTGANGDEPTIHSHPRLKR